MGIDGGGTKTEVVLLDMEGRVLATGLGGPSNQNYVGQETIDRSVQEAVLQAMQQADVNSPVIALVGMCIAGRVTVLEEILYRLGYVGEIVRYGEPQVAFARAGLEGHIGITAIAGTGSSFWGLNRAGREMIIGGWGPIAGEEGSGFDIGLQGIRAAGRSRDGRERETVLLQRALEHFGAADFGEILRRHCRPKIDQRAIAGFARVVTAAAIEGDQAAKRIARAAAESLASDIVHLSSLLFRPDEEFPVVLSGGVFSAGELITGPVTEGVRARFPNATVHVPRTSPGEAVARLTLRKLAPS